MSPTVFKIKHYRFFFFSREESRLHIHITSNEGEAKFWILPQIELCNQIGFKAHEITEIKEIIKVHTDEIIEHWNKHFRS